MTETIFFLGADERLVGVTTYCNYPVSAKQIAKVGDFSNPSIEKVVGLKPDLVLIALPEQKRMMRELKKFGIRIFVSHPHTIRDIIGEIDSLARILNRPSPRDSLLAFLKPQPAQRKRLKVYVELSSDPIITTGRSSFLNDLIDNAGGDNIFSDVPLEFPVVSWEKVFVRNPDVILIFHTGRFEGRNGWMKLEAVRSGRVFTDLDQDIFLRPGPRTFKALKILRSIINR
ncbi:MAG TPA: cobalamin-binding protein [bacterium (Candidatus Stahlbacteria)]|nr:cobalamin-binding protein [Candidatus Stahlbacteria bacterium]